MSREEEFAIADKITEQIRPMLEGLGPMIQSIIVADLTAAWLAGHLLHKGGEVKSKATLALREEILTNFLTLVRQLMPLHHARIMEEQKSRFYDPGLKL
jgi:hypothetical protein